MTLSVHRAKCVTAAVRAVELPLPPVTFMLPSSPFIFSLFLSLSRGRFAYLPNRDQTRIRFSRPRSPRQRWRFAV